MTQQNERTHHGPQLLTVTRLGNPQYGVAFAFGEIEGFYKAPRDQPNMQLNVGSQYMVAWTVKDNSPNRPYLDIVSAVLPDGQVARYDPQGNMVPGPAGPVVTPEQAADWADNPPQANTQPQYDDPLGPGPQPTEPQGDTRDATRKSIEKQVYVKELGAMLVVLTAAQTTQLLAIEAGADVNKDAMFTQEQIEWMRKEWLDGLWELKTGAPPPAQEGSEDG